MVGEEDGDGLGAGVGNSLPNCTSATAATKIGGATGNRGPAIGANPAPLCSLSVCASSTKTGGATGNRGPAIGANPAELYPEPVLCESLYSFCLLAAVSPS